MRVAWSKLAASTLVPLSLFGAGKPEIPAPRRAARPRSPGAARPAADAPVRRVQADETDLPPLPPPANLPANPLSLEGGMPLSLSAALYGSLYQNPDLVSLRQTTVASAEAVQVARRFPTTLNPTLWIECRPLVYDRVPGHGLDQKDAFLYSSYRQPVELGHQTRYRAAVAEAAYDQTKWTQIQAELLALVQTYRFFQTAAYRRERLRVARQLAEFNDRLVAVLRRRLEVNQAGGADVSLAEVEAEATRQLVEAARQDYVIALTDLRNQIGRPESAGVAEPLGEFILPTAIPDGQDPALIDTAIANRPEIHAAAAQVRGARAALGLANGDRIPTPIVGPVYERDEKGSQFFGFVFITPVPALNSGKPLVRQREAEYRRACIAFEQTKQRTVAQVKAALAKWNGANQLVARTSGLTDSLKGQVNTIERLFNENQTDLTKLLQARQRLIQLETAQLDAIWQATQAQADVLTALGAPTMIHALHAHEGPAPPPASTAAPMPPARP